MAINPAAVGTSAYELLDGSVSSFYASVDEAIAASEVVKGQYRMTINPAYNSPNPVDSNSFTTVGLTQSGPMVVDLENSYITTNVELTIKPDNNIPAPRADNTTESAIMFVGWKRSIEAIERYDILVNSTPIYTQSFCGEESFVMGQVDNDMVRKKSPFITSTYHNIINMEPGVCGTYVLLNGGNNMSNANANLVNTADGLVVNIPIKIPIAHFPILKNLKYLLSWMGKWEIRLYFSAQNLIHCLVDPDVVKKNAPLIGGASSLRVSHPAAAAIGGGAGAAFTMNVETVNPHNVPYTKADCKIQQFSEPIKLWRALNGSHAINAAADITWTATKMTLKDVSMNTAQFQIRMDILEMLKQKYMMEKPLTFPVSTFQIARFTGPPATNRGAGGHPAANSPLSVVLCQAINNCDTLFVLPFQKATHHTVCYNPMVHDLQLHAGEYGSYPTQPFNTYWNYGDDNIRFVNAAMDALNVNGSELCSFNEDVITSFVPKPMLVRPAYTINPGAALTEALQGATTYVDTQAQASDKQKDNTNFFIPFPFSTDDDFQGGMSSPSSNINFKLTGTFKDASVIVETPWVACFLIDGVIMIRPDPGSDAAKVIWSDRTVC